MQENYDVIIEPRRPPGRYWKELFGYRELFFFLAWRDILVRYKQTVIGIAWSVIRPAITMAVFTIVFGNLAKLPSNGVPYPIFVFCALLPWQLFAGALAESSNSLLANSSMLSKVYFPRIIIPISTIVVVTVDFLLSAIILAILMIWFGVIPSWKIIILPVLLLQAAATSLGCGLWLAALNGRYRDFKYVVPFIVQLGLYISPVGFTSSIVPGKWLSVYGLNPMAGVIEGFRWAILGTPFPLPLGSTIISVLLTAGILATGFWFFRRTERTLADFI